MCSGSALILLVGPCACQKRCTLNSCGGHFECRLCTQACIGGSAVSGIVCLVVLINEEEDEREMEIGCVGVWSVNKVLTFDNDLQRDGATGVKI